MSKALSRQSAKAFSRLSARFAKNPKPILWLMVFILAGLTTLLIGKAAVAVLSIEPETKTIAGNASGLIGSGASANGYVRFGSLANQDANLAKLLGATSRNRSADKPSYVNRPSAGLENDSTLYNSSYISSYNNSTTPGVGNDDGAGEFRAECDFSHFAYDDPILFPGQPGKAHLHMIFGNTHTNAYSNYSSLLNSGNSTCNGHELNRTAYWVPALMDQDGNPRKPLKIVVYYKSYSITSTGTNSWEPGNNGLEFVKPYMFPEGLQIINNFTRCTDPNLNWTQINLGSGCPANKQQVSLGAKNREINMAQEWGCNTVQRNGAHEGGRFDEFWDDRTQIRWCPPSEASALTSSQTTNVNTISQHVVFPYCTNNAQDMANRDYSTIKNDMKWNISWSWFSTVCPASHKYKIPQIQYKIMYPIYPGEDTSKWYLSSDIDVTTGSIKTTQFSYFQDTGSKPQIAASAKNGATSHGDWFGAWNRTIHEKWLNECNRINTADCAEGVFPVPVTGATKALVKPARQPLSPYTGSDSYFSDKGWYTLQYNNVFKVDGQQLFQQICGAQKLFTVGGEIPKGADIAYCTP